MMIGDMWELHYNITKKNTDGVNHTSYMQKSYILTQKTKMQMNLDDINWTNIYSILKYLREESDLLQPRH